MADRYALLIKADTNDADYVHCIRELSEEEYDALFPAMDRVVSALRKTHGEWQTSDQGDSVTDYVDRELLSIEDADMFQDLVPSAEYGIHTIEEITFYRYSNKERIY